MKKMWIMQALVIAGLGCGGLVATAADAVPEKKPQTTCPVLTANPINKQFYRDYNGKRVYFCCNNCPKEFDKDPAKYVKKLEDAGVTLEDAPKKAEVK